MKRTYKYKRVVNTLLFNGVKVFFVWALVIQLQIYVGYLT